MPCSSTKIHHVSLESQNLNRRAARPDIEARPSTEVLSCVASAGPAPIHRVLVVDDDEVALRVHKLQMAKRGYQVVLARSVEEARQVILEQGTASFDCVLTDFEMPGETGADLIDWLAKHDPTLAAIVVSAAGRMDSVASSMRSGALDFLAKPVQLQELEAALKHAVRRTHRRRELVRIEKAAQEVGLIQLRALRTQGDPLPAGAIVSHLPLTGAGGDFVSVLPMTGGRSLVILADVSGHDLRAAFISAYFQGMVRGMVAKGSDAAEVIAQFNHFLACDWIQQGSLDEVPLSIALTALTVEPVRGEIGVRNHGAPAAYLVRPDGWIAPCHTGGGCPLGWFDEAVGEETTIPLEDGGWLVVWTDGLEELASMLGVTAWTLAWDMLIAARDEGSFAERARAEDDILLFSLPLGIEEALPRMRPILFGRYHGGEAADIDAIQKTWERSLLRAIPGIPEDRLTDVLLCLREAVLNAILHGCQRDLGRSCTVQAVLGGTGGNLRIRVDDPGTGHGFDWEDHARQAEEQMLMEHRGLILLHAMTQSFETQRAGASVIFEMPIDPLNLNLETA
jgi:FixJ family two-component response regulator/anti-sigma regulatory factor (Ser/Thr protein kinase)